MRASPAARPPSLGAGPLPADGRARIRAALAPPRAASGAEGPGGPGGGAPSPGGRASSARAPLMRKVELTWLDPRGEVAEAARLVPALPAFEEAFAAFARGTLFPTSRGLVAVEDLLPGIELRVAGGAMRALLWRGSTSVVPLSEGSGRLDPQMTRLTRVAADALGIARPIQDLVLGPHARVVRRGPAVRALTGGEAALVPAAEMVDGDSIVAVSPASPVQVFHLGFEGHERLDAHGVEVESQHPGDLGPHSMPVELLGLWLSCFPHRRSLADWGPPALPRLSGHDLALYDAA